MHIDISTPRTASFFSSRLSSCRRPARTVAVVLTAGAAALALTACGGPAGKGDQAGTDGAGADKGLKLLWVGDSIAESEAPALGAALKAGGAQFKSMAAAGGGTVVSGKPPLDELSKSTWDELPGNIRSFKPDVIAYQITTYDWGTPEEQKKSYERLADLAAREGAQLVIVTAPPFKIDEFYKPNEGAIKTAPKSAREVAEKHPGKVRFLDAAALWGTDATADKALRSQDGIHSCQQGAAAFAKWFGGKLGEQFPFTPAAPQEWAKGSWTGDKKYAELKCS
ncbi:SGNH/GDSL hydrolase family protein [Streptomyces monticola]|uniref:SGNH/GDSL hydrolase family protein n=1 Tax=Streptomyces monticola TaxID=2666263 RepID=A0ABW2JA21_9ACTN